MGNPTIWPITGLVAIEFRCGGGSMRPTILPDGAGIRECRIVCLINYDAPATPDLSV
jgi:hypothetical protein